MHFGPQNFAQMLSTTGTVYPENLRGLQQKIFGESQKSANLSEHKFGTICKLVNQSQQLLAILLCKLSVMYPRYRRLTSLFSFFDILPIFRITRGLMCDFYADRKNSKFFNRIVHRRLWVQVHKIFHTCRASRGLFTGKVWRGVPQKILRKSPKTWNFCTCTCKSARCVYIRGSKVNIERTPCRPFSRGSTAV